MKRIVYTLLAAVMTVLCSCSSSLEKYSPKIDEALANDDFAQAHKLVDEMYTSAMNDSRLYAYEGAGAIESRCNEYTLRIIQKEADYLLSKGEDVAFNMLLSRMSEVNFKGDDGSHTSSSYDESNSQFNVLCMSVVRRFLIIGEVGFAKRTALVIRNDLLRVKAQKEIEDFETKNPTE